MNDRESTLDKITVIVAKARATLPDDWDAECRRILADAAQRVKRSLLEGTLRVAEDDRPGLLEQIANEIGSEGYVRTQECRLIIAPREDELYQVVHTARSDEALPPLIQEFRALSVEELHKMSHNTLEQVKEQVAHLELIAWVQLALERLDGVTVEIEPHLRLRMIFPQHTFPEHKALSQALADGPTFRYWQEVEGEIAMMHLCPGSTLHTKFEPQGIPGAWGKVIPSTPEEVRLHLAGTGIPGVLLSNVAITLALDDSRATRTMDDLIRSIGWIPRSVKERNEMREKVWDMLRSIASMRIIGSRRGVWKDRYTGEVMEVQTNDPMIMLGRRVEPVQAVLYPEGVPVAVAIAPGDWLDEFKRDKRVLSYFGNISKVARIPAGRAGGAWAQAIGLSLQQEWREGASTANVSHVGEANRLTVKFKPFTRRQLFSLFPPTPEYSPEKILASRNPSRAKRYWNDAIKILKAEGIIGFYQEVIKLPAGRQDWADEWLDQPLDIRPAQEGIASVAELADKGKVVRSRKKRQKRAKKHS